MREAAAQALANQAGEKTVLQALLKKLEDEDWRVREAAAQALANKAGEKTVLQALLKKLEDEDSGACARPRPRPWPTRPGRKPCYRHS